MASEGEAGDELRAGCLFTEASADEVRRAITGIRAGRSLMPSAWPHGARVAVAITFDVDHEFPIYKNEPSILSIGEYGATTALPRLLRLLDRHQIPATFFVPGMVQLVHPETVPQITENGRHEIGLHGWVHERAPDLRDRAEEAGMIARSVEVLTEANGGRRPIGYRAPNNALSNYTLELLQENGVVYDTSLSARDEPHEILFDGAPAEIIELPVSWESGDYLYLHHDEFWRGSLPLPSAVLEIYKNDFDVAYEEGTLFVLTLHPQVIGRRSRATILDQFIEYVKSRGDVWIATMADIANHVKSSGSEA